MSSAAPALALVAALQRTRREEGNVVITTEGGATIRAHGLILSLGSEYFKTALSATWQEEGRRELALQAAPAVVAAAVDYMYGIEVPSDFGLEAAGVLGELLELADRLLMDELKEEAGRRLALRLSVDNYRDACGLAERYHAGALAAACARFVVEEVEEPDWAVIDQAPIVAGAMARLAIEMKGKMYKKFKDFGSSEDYGVYVRGVVKVGMRVRCRGRGGWFDHSPLVEVGDVGRVAALNYDMRGALFRVAWEGVRELLYVSAANVEVLPAAP